MSETFKRPYSYNYIFQTVNLSGHLFCIRCERILSYTKNRVEVVLRSILTVADMSLKKIYRAVFAGFSVSGTEKKAGMPTFCPPQATEL